MTYELIYRKIGFNSELYDKISVQLYARDLIRDYKADNDPHRYIRVSKVFIQAFYPTERDFEEFWRDKDKVCWPGARAEAQTKYNAARKGYPHDYLMKQRNWYFRYLELPENTWRQKMMASVFLNMKTKRFEEDWEQHVRETTGAERKVEPTRPLTKEEKETLFT